MNETNQKGETPLHAAGNQVNNLLTHLINLLTPIINILTPLNDPIHTSNTSNTPPNNLFTSPNNLFTPYAGNQGHHRCVELLLGAPGIKVNESDLASMSPLISCCAHVSQAVEHINQVGLQLTLIKGLHIYNYRYREPGRPSIK